MRASLYHCFLTASNLSIINVRYVNRTTFREAWDRIDIRQRIVLLLLVVVLAVVLGVWRIFFPCDAKERTALAEFQHYGERKAGEDLNVQGNELSRFTLGPTNTNGSCMVGYTAFASQDQVSAYYAELLAEHGWAVERVPLDTEGEFEHPHINGSRDGLHYVVHYFGPGPRGPDVTEVRVQVFRS